MHYIQRRCWTEMPAASQNVVTADVVGIAQLKTLRTGRYNQVMAYDEGVAERLRDIFAGQPDITEKKMFGGIAFMHAGNMCCGIVNDVLMARVGPENYEKALGRQHAREMDFTGRSMKGFVYVDPTGIAKDRQLRQWIDLCMQFTSSLPAK